VGGELAFSVIASRVNRTLSTTQRLRVEAKAEFHRPIDRLNQYLIFVVQRAAQLAYGIGQRGFGDDVRWQAGMEA